MPERALESGVNGGTRNVRLYCETGNALWLCSLDANWAMLYLRDQLASKGVKPVAPDDRGPGARPEAHAPGND